MDAEQNDTTDSNIVEDTRDALCEDAESLESTEKDAKINGNGDTDENDGASGGASGGDGAAGNDDDAADDAADDGEMEEEEEEEEEEEATPPGNVETIVELEDIYPFPEKNNPPDDDGPESERKRSIDDAECDDYGPLPTFPLKRARTAYFIFADEKRKAVSQEVCPPSLRMDHLCRYPDDFSDSFSLSRHATLNDSTRERASPPSRRRSANFGLPSAPRRRKFTRARRRRRKSGSVGTCSVSRTPDVGPMPAPTPRRGRTS